MNAPIGEPRRASFGASARHHNLPARHTQLFGREQHSATVRALVVQGPGRLVTLTGTGGCGKTQLALEVATSLLNSFPDGVWLMDLVPLQATHLVLQTVMSTLGLSEQPGETPLQTLVGWTGSRRVLFVFDNCEHLIDASAQLAEALLNACPNVRVLTTSRQPLRISGESVWRVPSLGIPEPRSDLSPQRVVQYPAVRLFVQRAQAVKSDFVVTSRNASALSAICARLEGLPLAIELAAVWVRALSVQQILERLHDTFDLLVGGSRCTRSPANHASLACRQGNYAEARALLQEVRPHLRPAQALEPRLLHSLYIELSAIALSQGDHAAARTHGEKALAAARAAGHHVDEAAALHHLGWLAFVQADYVTARALCEDSQSLARVVGDEWPLCNSVTRLAQVAFHQGDLLAARRLVDEGLALARRLGDLLALPLNLDVVARLAIADGHPAAARQAMRESLLIRRNLGSRSLVTYSLESIAALAAAEGDPQSALRLAGAATSIRDTTGEQQSKPGQAMIDQWLTPLQHALGRDAVHSAWEAGRAMSIERAVELATAATECPPRPQPDDPSAGSNQRVTELSPREQQVAALLADGLTNRQIAERLAVTERTVAAHIEHILNKLGFASRHQVAT